MTSPDVRPISTDHLELFSSVNVYPSLDHQVLPQVGPTRNSRTLRQPSPYSSPDTGGRHALFVRSGCSPDSKSDSDDSDTELSSDVGPDSSPWRPADRCISAYTSDESITAKTPPRQSNCPVHTYASDESITAKTPLHQSSHPVFAYDCDENSGHGNQINKKDASGSKISGKQSATRSFPNVDESDSSNDDSDYIDKPPGEAGRPECGGYTLRNSVTWTDRKYAKVKVCHYLLIHPILFDFCSNLSMI